MVNVKVVRVFNDKDTDQFTKLGDVLSKPKERADKLIEGGFVELIEAPNDAESKTAAEKPVKAKPSTKEEKKFD